MNGMLKRVKFWNNFFKCHETERESVEREKKMEREKKERKKDIKQMSKIENTPIECRIFKI